MAYREEENQRIDLIPQPQPLAMAARRDPDVDLQVSTAKMYPRVISKAIKAAVGLATYNQEIAESCMYALPRKNSDGSTKTIDGPSVRLAEIVASSWGNLRVEAKPLGDDGKFTESEATCWDLEANVAIRVRTKRRITDKNGRRYSDDMVGVTSNAASSIALRNAVLRVVPRSVIDEVYRSARKVAVGTQQTLAARREAALATFGKLGVRPEQVFAKIGRAAQADITLDDLAVLLALHNSIKDGDVTIDEAFPVEKPTTAPGNGNGGAPKTSVEKAKEALRAAQAPQVAPEPQTQANPPAEPTGERLAETPPPPEPEKKIHTKDATGKGRKASGPTQADLLAELQRIGSRAFQGGMTAELFDQIKLESDIYHDDLGAPVALTPAKVSKAGLLVTDWMDGSWPASMREPGAEG